MLVTKVLEHHSDVLCISVISSVDPSIVSEAGMKDKGLRRNCPKDEWSGIHYLKGLGKLDHNTLIRGYFVW